jgi:hypothetical protein
MPFVDAIGFFGIVGGFAFERTFECSVDERDEVFVLCISFTGAFGRKSFAFFHPGCVRPFVEGVWCRTSSIVQSMT